MNAYTPVPREGVSGLGGSVRTFADMLSQPSGREKALANGNAYVLRYEDFVDQFGYPIGVKTDTLTGERRAYHATGFWLLDVPLCGGCDDPLPPSGYCRGCGWDLSQPSSIDAIEGRMG